jgi:two-component system, OmpR family, sensor histidine kinase BaeS
VLAVRGAPPVSLRDAQGQPVYLYVLPAPGGSQLPPSRLLLPSWILVTAAIGAVALVFTFALSRRILRPVSALTIAAGRLEEGKLDVQVEVKGDDEIAGLARAFNAMASRLAATEQVRRQMVTDVAHELRSPVTNLRCTLEAMQDGLAPLDRAAVDALHEETLFLQRLIADLQDLALAEAGRLELHVTPVDITEIVRRAVTPLAAASGARITVAAPPTLPALAADPDRLEQILRNLLTNARRHTPADGAIEVRMIPGDSSIRIVVSDTGRGIEAAHLPHVFDRFYRADASRARATGGAGLGLAIVRQLVAAHHGTIEAESEGPGRGARFVVVLPLSAG